MFNQRFRSIFQLNAENDDGFTALHAATDVGSTKTVEALLEAGARTDATNTYRETCLHTAARRNLAHIAETLLLHGCPVDRRNLAGQTEVTFTFKARLHVYTKHQSQRCDNSVMTLVILLLLKTVESLETPFWNGSIVSMRTLSLVSSWSCLNIDSDAWCKLAPKPAF